MKWNTIYLTLIMLAGTTAAHNIIIGDNILWGTHVIPNIATLNITITTPEGQTYTQQVLVTINTTGNPADKIWYVLESVEYFYTAPVYQGVTVDYKKPYGINYTLTAYANNSANQIFNTSISWIALAPPINQTFTDNMNTLVVGKPLHAAKDAQEDVSDKFFFTFILASIFVAMWLRTQSYGFSLMVLDMMYFVFANYIHPEVLYVLYGMNAVMVGGILYRAFSPTITK